MRAATLPSSSIPSLRGAGLVDEDQGLARRLRVHEPQRERLAGLAEEALAGPEDRGEDHQPVLFDEAVLYKRLHKLDASVYEDIPLDVTLQRGDGLGYVAADHRRVVPFGVCERRRDDVLRHVVELVGELPRPRRPGRGEPLIGHPAEQQGTARHKLLVLELVAFGPAIELEGPAAPVEILGPAGVLDHPVERDELRDHHLAHVLLLSVGFSTGRDLQAPRTIGPWRRGRRGAGRAPWGPCRATSEPRPP